ncbi:MAG TPA: beta-galactosidase [Solirubrobacterales bacterium]
MIRIARLATIALALALPAAPAQAAGRAPAGFVGISPQSAPSDSDYELMAEADVASVRLPLAWSQIEPVNPSAEAPDWSSFDHAVELAADHGLRVFPFVWGTPPWLSEEPGVEPVTPRELRAWRSFLRRAALRYGPYGEFWEEHPELTPEPIRSWEIWNEPNIVTFGSADPEGFAKVLRAAGQVLHRVEPGSKVILGGLFGRPLQVPPNMQPGNFLSQVYRARGVKRWFDGVGLHPYVAGAAEMRGEIVNLRRVMALHNDASTPIYVTELGWGSASYESRWERGLYGQADQLSLAFSMLSSHRRSWRIAGVWWFSWADAKPPTCQFCDSAGLLTDNREAKPAWYRFNSWTGGDAETVPRAEFEPGPFGWEQRLPATPTG